MTCFWTVLGRGLDRGWTNIGFSVQYLSNQPKLTSTNVHNMFKICVNVVTILSNRFETDFELDAVMRMEAMLKNCLKCVQLCINRF